MSLHYLTPTCSGFAPFILIKRSTLAGASGIVRCRPASDLPVVAGCRMAVRVWRNGRRGTMASCGAQARKGSTPFTRTLALDWVGLGQHTRRTMPLCSVAAFAALEGPPGHSAGPSAVVPSMNGDWEA